jgi:uncharacterized protein (TIGR02271 family)
MPHRKPWSELTTLLLVGTALLIAAAFASVFHSAQAWLLLAVLGAAYALSRGVSRNDWPAYGLPAPPERSRGASPGARTGATAGEAVAEVVVSEEQLEVDRRAHPHERVRLRKEVITDEVTITVPIRREVVRIERIPIEPGMEPDVDELTAFTGGEIQELVLMEEQAVVDKRVVPRERVRLAKDVVTEEQHITRTVRREEVEVDREPTGTDQTGQEQS